MTNTGSDRAQLANIASRAKDVLGVDKLEAVADRGYYSGEEILACDKAGFLRASRQGVSDGECNGPGLRCFGTKRLTTEILIASPSLLTALLRIEPRFADSGFDWETLIQDPIRDHLAKDPCYPNNYDINNCCDIDTRELEINLEA